MIKKLFHGWTHLPKVSPLEGFFSRLLFAVLLLFTLRIGISYTAEPHPVGLLKLLHAINDDRTWLTWLADADIWSTYRGIFTLLLFLYVAGTGLPVVLPVLAVMHVLPFTLYNSQGFSHHGYQIVSCTLIIQACAVVYYSVRQKLTLMPPDEKLRAWMFVQAQVILTGMYFISVFTKMDNSGGMWLWNSNNVALDMIKTFRQSYLNQFDPTFAGNPPEALWMLERPWLSRAFFGSGLFLELFCILAIGNRWLGFIMGLSLLAMHRSIDWLMGGVAFINNEFLAFIYLVNLPFLMAWPLERLRALWVRRGVVAGALAGLVASYWFNPAGKAARAPADYAWDLIRSIEVWSSLEWAQWQSFGTFIQPVAITVVVGAAAGAALGAVVESMAGKRSSKENAPAA
jgi:hypothetical protein